MSLARTGTFLLVTLVLIGFLLGCATHPAAQQAVPVSEMPQKQEAAVYIIQPGDELDIKFFYNPELNETITVRPDGKISLQLIDEVHATGRQPAELDDMLTKAYSGELKKPVITVIVRSFAGQRIYVGGEVKQQSEMVLPPGMTLLQAIFQAGGLKETASPENVILIRQGKNREPIPVKIDLKNALYGQGTAANLALLPNDIIYVPKSAIAEANKWVHQYIEQLILFKGFSAGVTYQINEFNNTN